MRIYHLVWFSSDNSIYAFFNGCNFSCKGCILKKSRWDCHLDPEIIQKLEQISSPRYISLQELKSILVKIDPSKLILGGAEPSLDPDLIQILELCSELGIKPKMLTNGWVMDGLISRLKEFRELELCISLKSFDSDLHEFYTGYPNSRILRNFRDAYLAGIELMAESVLIPGLIDESQIVKISQFISELDPQIRYRIDGYIQVPGAPWRSAAPREVIHAADLASKYLRNVSYLHSGISVKGRAINLYP